MLVGYLHFSRRGMAVRLVSLVRLFLVGYIILAVAVTFGLYKSYETSQDGKRAKFALCAFTQDLENRIVNEQSYISLSTGPSKQLLVSLVTNQQKTVDAIKPKLHCG